MQNYFDSEIKRLNSEILYLKTTAQKSAGVVETKSKSVNTEVTLEIRGSATVAGDVTYEVVTSEKALVMVTLDKYYDDINANDHASNWSRSVKPLVYRPSTTTTRIYLFFRGNPSDWSTISGGGTVKMTAKLTVRCTDDFTLSEV